MFRLDNTRLIYVIHRINLSVLQVHPSLATDPHSEALPVHFGAGPGHEPAQLPAPALHCALEQRARGKHHGGQCVHGAAGHQSDALLCTGRHMLLQLVDSSNHVVDNAILTLADNSQCYYGLHRFV